MDNYQRIAEQRLNALAALKCQQRALEQEIKDLQAKLTEDLAHGDLNHLKTDSENTYKFENINFTWSAGSITYDFSDFPEIAQAQEKLTELKNCAKSLLAGTNKQNVGTPFWTVRA